MTEAAERIKGYAGRILRVDLSTGDMTTEEPSERFYREYLGGAGFVGYYLLREVPKGADPLGPENRLIFAGGTLTGIPVAGAGRSHMGAKSPLTGGYGEADVGGFFGAEMKRAGFDALIIHGQAEEPVYLYLHDGQAELRPARHLWGKDTLETQNAIQDELDERRARVAAIGPGGEKLVRYACVMFDVSHAAGRTGLGAVMGAKKLKAVAALGSGPVDVADPDKVKELGRWYASHWKEKHEGLHDLGTAGGLMALNASGALPTRNFQDGQFEGAERISGEAMRDTILVERGGCFACPVRCKRGVQVDEDGYVAEPGYGGPEYETLGSFGSVCGVDDLRAIAAANQICNGAGLDTISAGMTVAFAMECYENGLIDQSDTDGLDLRFGNGQAMVALTQRIADREGFGDLLAEGMVAAAAQIGQGAEQYAIHVKGQALPMHEARFRHGQGLGYAVSPTGADHIHNMWDEGLGKTPTAANFQAIGAYTTVPQTELGPDKVRAFVGITTWRWLANFLGWCGFIGWTNSQMIELITAITGWDTNWWELMKTSQRGVTMARLFNLREGLGREQDTLPARLAQPHVSGSLNEKPITPEALQEAITLYYGMMGWDPQTGMPTTATLAELDLSWAEAYM